MQPPQAALPPPHVAPPALATVKTEPPGKESSLPVYVTVEGCNSVPAGEVRSPICNCRNKLCLSYRPGLHATWDCPLLYWSIWGCCPGFLPSGDRDPSQWTGEALTPAAKRAWVDLIRDKHLKLLNGNSAGPLPLDR